MTAKPRNTIKQQISELDTTVEWFYSDDFNLEDAVAKYRQALKLSEQIERDLLELKNQVEILPEDFTKAEA